MDNKIFITIAAIFFIALTIVSYYDLKYITSDEQQEYKLLHEEIR